MDTKTIVNGLVEASTYSPGFDERGMITEWRESDTEASLMIEFANETFEINITVRKK